MLCFSCTRYEDVAMWMSYGKWQIDAIRIRFDGRDVRDWWANFCMSNERFVDEKYSIYPNWQKAMEL